MSKKSLMPFVKSDITKILVISLSNIGDVVLTLPVLDILLQDFPQAQLSVVVGPKAGTLFDGNPFVHKVHIFDKKQPLYKTIGWVADLWRERFDLVIDLRNTAIPFLIFPRYRTPAVANGTAGVHMKYKHLGRLRAVYPDATESQTRHAFVVPEKEKAHLRDILRAAWGENFRYIAVAPGAASAAKRWNVEGFSEVCYQLVKRYPCKIVLVGDENDRGSAERISGALGADALNLCGRTTLVQSGAVLRHAVLAIVNDSAVMHLASYLDVPVLALFGPSDVRKYGPWGCHGQYLQKNRDCSACRDLRGAASHTCMSAISSQEVLDRVSTKF